MRDAMARTALLVGFLACAPVAETPTHDPAADKAAIDAVRNREMTAINAGNIDSLLAVYADDIDMMAPGIPAAHGMAAVREMATGMLKEMTVTANYTSSSIEVTGDIAIDRYALTMTMTPRAGGAAVTEQMKGLHILRRQTDSSWRIVQDIWNADGPTPPAAPPAK